MVERKQCEGVRVALLEAEVTIEVLDYAVAFAGHGFEALAI
jgi:hypothetical protein